MWRPDSKCFHDFTQHGKQYFNYFIGGWGKRWLQEEKKKPFDKCSTDNEV